SGFEHASALASKQFGIVRGRRGTVRVGSNGHSRGPRRGSPRRVVMPREWTPDDVEVLREAYIANFGEHDALTILIRIGYPDEDRPGWSTQRTFWTFIFERVENKVPGGYDRLLNEGVRLSRRYGAFVRLSTAALASPFRMPLFGPSDTVVRKL